LKRDASVDGVAQVELTSEHVVPCRRGRIFKIRHKHLGTGVECINHHLSIDRSGDLDATVRQVGGNARRARPVARTHIRRLGKEIRQLARIELRLTMLALSQQRTTTGKDTRKHTQG
jgi:hypothetical protein